MRLASVAGLQGLPAWSWWRCSWWLACSGWPAVTAPASRSRSAWRRTPRTRSRKTENRKRWGSKVPKGTFTTDDQRFYQTKIYSKGWIKICGSRRTSPLTMRTLASHHPHGSLSFALEYTWQTHAVHFSITFALILNNLHFNSILCIYVLAILEKKTELFPPTSTSSLSFISLLKPVGGGKRTSWNGIWRSGCQLGQANSKNRLHNIGLRWKHSHYVCLLLHYSLVFKCHSDGSLVDILHKSLWSIKEINSYHDALFWYKKKRRKYKNKQASATIKKRIIQTFFWCKIQTFFTKIRLFFVKFRFVSELTLFFFFFAVLTFPTEFLLSLQNSGFFLKMLTLILIKELFSFFPWL